MKVGDYCVRDVVCVEPKASLYTVAEMMRHHHVGSVLVASSAQGSGTQRNSAPLGIITDRDLVIEVIAPRIDPDTVVAEDVMSFKLIVAREDDELWDAVHRMEQDSVRRIPVVNSNEQLVGIFCLDDLLKVVASELSGIANLVTYERNREAVVRR
ncbi:MAG: CBS domain-containing protein [Cellvibrionaceae bacterium]